MRARLLLLSLTPLLLACPTEEPVPCEQEAAFEGTADGLSYDLPDCVALDLAAEPRGEGELSLRWEAVADGLQPIVTAHGEGAVLEGLVLRGSLGVAGEGPLRFWRQGFQSWSFAGVVETTDITLDETGLPEVGGEGDTGSFLRDREWTSWWLGLLGRPEGGASLLAGALSADVLKFHLATDGDELWLIWGTRGESVPLADGEELALDPLWLGAGVDPFAMHVAYGEAVARRTPPPELPSKPATGWSTWYVFYEDVDEEDVRRNLDYLAARKDAGETSVELIQVDDGWQRVWGDWHAGDDFPSGMEQLAADITQAGFVPGLWMAPLYVDRSTSAWIDHPDWWVRDEAGEQLAFSNLGTGDYAILDVTCPDAAAWYQQQLRDRVDEGWTYLKLDFLYAGSQEGRRCQDMTGMQAYRTAMQLTWAAVGGDAELLASGAPMLPSVGWFQAFRTGADIAFSHDPDPVRQYLRWQVRETAARSWQNGLWWWNDADALLVREPFDVGEAGGSIIANVVSGGAWLLGDDLPLVDEARVDAALNPALLDTMGYRVEPLDPLSYPSGFEIGPIVELINDDDQTPLEWRLASGLRAVLNMGDVPVEVSVPAGRELMSGEQHDGGQLSMPAGNGGLYLLMSDE
jgi:hypothetical protein